MKNVWMLAMLMGCGPSTALVVCEGSESGATEPSETGCEPPPGCTQSPIRGSWTELASLAVGRQEPMLAWLDGDLVVVGGRTCGEDARALGAVERYSPERNAWTKLPNLPNARVGGQVVAIDDRLFVVGGVTEAGPDREVLMYSIGAVGDALGPAA